MPERKPPRQLSRGSLVLWLLLPLAAGCWSSPPATSDVARPVRTFVVAAGEDNMLRTFPGRVEASRKAELAFQVAGLLVDLPVKEGQRVAKGDLLGQIRKDEFQARLTALQGELGQARAALRALQAGDRPEQRLRLEAQVRAAEATLANARSEYERNARLRQTNAISQLVLDRSETAYRVAQEDHQAAMQLLEKGTIAREEDLEAQEATVRGLEGRVTEASIQLDDTTLRAPYDGVIAQRHVDQGQNVRAKEPIVTFQDVDEIDIAVDVPEAVMTADLRSADIVQLTAELSGAPGVEFPVQIREVSQVADPTTQTFRVRAAMQAPPGIQVLPGMTATVTASYRRAAILGSRMLIPISAIQRTPGSEQVVWLVGGDGNVTSRVVKIGEAAGGRVEVLDGLAPGDRIAVAGVTFLREGMKVRDLGDALGGSL
jgi:multidrug efflux system membrane fusion protein